MRLHLPLLLYVFVMLPLVMPSKALTSADIKDNCLDVGVAELTTSLNEQKVDFEGDLVVSDGMQVGAFVDGVLMTTFGDKSKTGEQSKSLNVTGSVTIQDSGKIILGGQTHSNSYMGLYASNVTVNGSGDMSQSNPNLSATMAYIDNLTINSGTVVLRANEENFAYAGSSGVEGAANSDQGSKQTWIKSKLNVTGGNLIMGTSAGSDSYTTTYNSHYLQAIGTSSAAATIEQSGGSIAISGKTIVYSGLKINQTGGSMSFADEKAGRTMIMFVGSGSNTINQNSDNKDTVLTLGEMGANTLLGSWLLNKKDASAVVNITQDGAGTINLAKGVTYTSSTASSITQKGTGKINLSGDFTSASFNLKQSEGSGGEITVKSGAAMTSSSIVQAGTAAALGIDGTLTLAEGGSGSLSGAVLMGEVGTLNVNGSLTLNKGAQVHFSISDNARAAITVGSSGSLAATEAEVSLTLDDVMVQNAQTAAAAAFAGGAKSYTYTIDLISGLTDAAMESLLAEDVLSLSSINLPQTLADTSEVYSITERGFQASATESGVMQAYVTWKSNSLPEPSTATLSLLALAGLAVRRRRK